jgi:hypothetical protein
MLQCLFSDRRTTFIFGEHKITTSALYPAFFEPFRQKLSELFAAFIENINSALRIRGTYPPPDYLTHAPDRNVSAIDIAALDLVI